MLRTYARALAPGTLLNKQKQAHCNIKFAVLHDVPYLNPTTVHVCMYTQYLSNSFGSVSSVKYYISGAKSWVIEHGSNVDSFLTQKSMMIKSVTKDSTHVDKRAFPLALEHISVIAAYLDRGNAPLSIKPCVLIGFSCYLRSSNLVSPNFSTWGGTHSLLAKNVIDCRDYLRVIITSTKSHTLPYSLCIPSLQAQHICPVLAWRRYNATMNLDPHGPAFVLTQGAPLTAAVVVRLMRDALSNYPDIDTSSISMHSLRRGAAQEADKAGLPLSDIMHRGGWASHSGVKPYLL